MVISWLGQESKIILIFKTTIISKIKKYIRTFIIKHVFFFSFNSSFSRKLCWLEIIYCLKIIYENAEPVNSMLSAAPGAKTSFAMP